jgi:hypothetical protein
MIAKNWYVGAFFKVVFLKILLIKGGPRECGLFNRNFTYVRISEDFLTPYLSHTTRETSNFIVKLNLS